MRKKQFALERVRSFKPNGYYTTKVVALTRQIDRRELVRAAWLFALAAVALLSLISVSAAKPRKPASVSSARVLEPCKDGFSFLMSYGAAQGVSENPAKRVALHFIKNGNAEASDLNHGLKNSVSPELCQAWQKHAWPQVDRMIAQSKLKTRSNFQCINLARIEYSLAGQKKNAGNLCIGNRREDAMSNAFYKFLDQTTMLTKKGK